MTVHFLTRSGDWACGAEYVIAGSRNPLAVRGCEACEMAAKRLQQDVLL